MQIAYIAVTALLIIALLYVAWADFARPAWLLSTMARVDVPESWLPALCVLKAAGAIGLFVGFWVPIIGKAAAAGVTVYFIGAIITNLRAGYYNWHPVAYFVLSVAVLALCFA